MTSVFLPSQRAGGGGKSLQSKQAGSGRPICAGRTEVKGLLVLKAFLKMKDLASEINVWSEPLLYLIPFFVNSVHF